MVATCKKFWEYCRRHSIQLLRKNFELRYETNIPRQVGLGGSSAIITAAFNTLMKFYGLTEADISKPIQPNLVLSVETEELGIWAGLQDRVVQVYGGMVYMDFNEDFMSCHNHGIYENLAVSLLPPLFLAYSTSMPTESTKTHQPIYTRYQQSDRLVITIMAEIAQLTEVARHALETGQTDRFGELMNKNFDLRRRLYGDASLGPTNLEMVAIARQLGLPVKFPGSGGAIIGICAQDQFTEVQRTFHQYGYQCCRVRPTESEENSLG